MISTITLLAVVGLAFMGKWRTGAETSGAGISRQVTSHPHPIRIRIRIRIRRSHAAPFPDIDRRHVDAGVAGVAEAAGQAPSEYLLAAGLTYLNTASLGPTPRAVLEQDTRGLARSSSRIRSSWRYGDGPVLNAADRTRELAAGLLGCTADEILITRSTTDAMNSLAQGIRLVQGDRVLMTDQEHEGGSLGWQYRSRRDGVRIDIVPDCAGGSRSRRDRAAHRRRRDARDEGDQHQPCHRVDRPAHAHRADRRVGENPRRVVRRRWRAGGRPNRRQRQIARMPRLCDRGTQVVDGAQRHRTAYASIASPPASPASSPFSGKTDADSSRTRRA